MISLTTTFVTPHSPPQGPVGLCNSSFFALSCQSEFSSFYFGFEALSAESATVIRSKSNLTELQLRLTLVGTQDGIPLDYANSDTTTASFFSGIGFLPLRRSFQALGRLSEFKPGNNQFQSFATRIFVSPFRELLYDPDASLSLLFAIEDPATGPVSQTNLQESANTAAIAGGVVAAVVAVAGIAAVTLLIRRRNFEKRAQNEMHHKLNSAQEGKASAAAHAQQASSSVKQETRSDEKKWKKAAPS